MIGRTGTLGVFLRLLDDHLRAGRRGLVDIKHTLVWQELWRGCNTIAGIDRFRGCRARAALTAADDALEPAQVDDPLAVRRPARLGLVALLGGDIPAGGVIGVDDGNLIPLAVVGDVHDQVAIGSPG